MERSKEPALPKWLYILIQVRRRLWLTAACYSVLGVTAALVAAQFARYVPAEFPLKLGSGAVDDILTILASSMLAVTTFALTTFVTAYTAVVASISPRAARLLIADAGIRNVLGTFVGAFIYAIVGIIALHTDYYGDQGRVILFFVTIAVLFLVVLAMLHWIAQLTDFAQTDKVIQRVAKAAEKALDAPITVLRAARASSPPPDGQPVRAIETGFVQNVDLKGLQNCAEDGDFVVHVSAMPGAFVHVGEPILWLVATPDERYEEQLRSFVTIGAERTVDQDPVYAFQVLGEIAARALSPGVNDPGTARQVVARTAILLRRCSAEVHEPVREARVHFQPLQWQDLLQESLGPVSQYGAEDVGLQIALQEGLSALARDEDERGAAAREFSRSALARAVEALQRTEDRKRLVQAVEAIASRAAA